MRLLRRTVPLLLIVLLLLPMTALAESSGPVFVSLTLPASVEAGTTLHVEVVGQAKANGLCNGSIALKGPSDQHLYGDMFRKPGTDSLVLDLPLSKYLQPGPWSVDSLTLYDCAENSLVLEDGKPNGGTPFHYTFAVTNGMSDAQSAYLQDMSLSPQQVEQGAPFTISVKLVEPPAGVKTVEAWLADRRGDVLPPWSRRVVLKYNPDNGRWEGSILAPVLPTSQTGVVTIWVRNLFTRTNAGVERYFWCGPFRDPIPGTCTFQVAPAQVLPALKTSSGISLFYPSPLDFFAWADKDTGYLRGLFDRLDTDPSGVQEMLAAQLPALSTALAKVRGEIYQDADSGVHIATPNTTGKFLALAAALRGRLLLWSEVQRRASQNGTPPLTLDILNQSLPLLNRYGSVPVSSEIYDQQGALVTQRYLESIKNSRIPARIWSQPLSQDWLDINEMALTRDVIWVAPYTSSEVDGWEMSLDSAGGIVLTIPDKLPGWIDFALPIHELGHRFHDVFLGGSDGQNPLWAQYLALRGNHVWYGENQIAHDGRPWENFAEDFARTFSWAKLAAQRDGMYMYNGLQNDPTAMAQFRDFVLGLAKSSPPPFFRLNKPLDSLTVLPPGPVDISGSWAPGGSFDYWTEELTTNNLGGVERWGATVTAAADGSWKLTVPQGASSLQGIVIQPLGAHDTRLGKIPFLLFRPAARLDQVPLQAPAGPVTISGVTLPDAQVWVGAQSAVVAADGRFSVPVNLKPGINQVRVRTFLADGTFETTTAEVTVGEQAIPLTVGSPSWSGLSSVTLTGTTAPGATVQALGQTAAADASGHFTLPLKIPYGYTSLAVTATQAGKTASWYGTVLGSLDLSITARATAGNGSAIVFGQTNPLAVLTLNGNRVAVAADGSFRLETPLKNGQNKLTLVATDDWGNQKTWEQTFTLQTVVQLQVGSTTGIVGGSTRTMPVPPQILDGSTYVPLRFLAEALGAKLTWNGETRTATFELDGRTVQLTTDSQTALVNGRQVTLATPVRNLSGSTMVPVRFVSENLGAKVKWDAATQWITLTYPGGE